MKKVLCNAKITLQNRKIKRIGNRIALRDLAYQCDRRIRRMSTLNRTTIRGAITLNGFIDDFLYNNFFYLTQKAQVDFYLFDEPKNNFVELTFRRCSVILHHTTCSFRCTDSHNKSEKLTLYTSREVLPYAIQIHTTEL